MNSGDQGNAMTEIALAMAMGFFSVMVLTTLSMGIGDGKTKRISTAILAESVIATEQGNADRLSDDDILVIYDGRRFFDRRLAPVAPSAIAAGRRIVLAVDPALPIERALKARNEFTGKRVILTSLTADWRQALKERRHDR